MRRTTRLLATPFYRDLVIGGASGLLAGVVFWWALHSQSMTSSVPGLLGLDLAGAKLRLHLLVSIPLGMGLVVIARWQSLNFATTLSVGALCGLLWWIAGPLTFGALIDGRGPTWSLDEASVVFPSLIGHLLYGGLTGLGFYLIVNLYLRFWPEPEQVSVPADAPKKRVVILGGGFGGTSVAQRLEQIFARGTSVEITLVSQSNYLLFTPMLAEVASSALEAQHISAPVRASCPNTQFRRAEVVEIDTLGETVSVRSNVSAPPVKVPYDHLVLAVGSVANFFELPGVEQHSFTLKALEDATQLRNHVIGLLERADSEPDEVERRRQLTFVVAGGGFAGTETIAELCDLVHSVMRFYPNIAAKDPRFVLIHSRDRILPELSAGLGEYALRKLEARGIEFLLNARVIEATADAVLINGQEPVATRTLVWTAGNQPNPLLANIPCEKTQAGAVLVGGSLQVNGFSNIWAVGDCAQIPDPDNQGQSYPPTGAACAARGQGSG